MSFNFKNIELSDLQEHFQIGELTKGDSNFRETKKIPTYEGETLRFRTPWMFSRFGWGGKYNTLTVQSSSKGKFPLDDPASKKQFRRFLMNLGTVVEQHVTTQPNPNNLNLSWSKQVVYDENYGYYKYYFNIPKSHIDAEGEFEGKVFKSTNVEDPDFTPSSLKAIEPNSYIELFGYIGKITQSKNAIRYNIVVEQIHWYSGSQFIEKTEDEKITNNTNLFLNVPTSSKKRKVTVKVDYKEDEDIVDLSSSSKKVKSGTD